MPTFLLPRSAEVRHFHLFCGAGGGAIGFNRACARIGHVQASMRCIGGVDSDPAAIADFRRLAGPGTVLDLATREQHEAINGRPAPSWWREATAEDIRAAAGGEFPHIVFLSPPCKGFSGLLNKGSAKSAKYQAMNGLTVQGIRLMLLAFADCPPEFVILENVPRIEVRGVAFLEEIQGLLEGAGYVVQRTRHNCGEVGGLAQNRHRFLLVARHAEKLPSFIYQPRHLPMKTIGQVIGALPMPDEEAGGPLHQLPALQWKTWLRLALIEAGSDWRSLEKLTIEDGTVQGLALEPLGAAWHNGVMGVKRWDGVASTITGQSRPATGPFSVADHRFAFKGRNGFGNICKVNHWDDQAPTVTGATRPAGGLSSIADPTSATSWGGKGKYRVNHMEEQAGTVIAESSTGNGAFAIADPTPKVGTNPQTGKAWDYGMYGVRHWDGQAPTLSGQANPGSGGFSIADPTVGSEDRQPFNNVWRVIHWDGTAQALTSGGGPSAGGQSIADVRINLGKEHGYTTCGQSHYGVMREDAQAHTVRGNCRYDQGPFSVADHRLPDPEQRCKPLIISLDGTRHRPFTPLDVAALQGFPVEDLILHGVDNAGWRERIGNAVPPPAAEAIASTAAETLLLHWAQEVRIFEARPIWVRQIAIAFTLPAAPALPF